MTDRDEELRAMLKNWKAPLPSAELDARVWSEFSRSRPPRRSWLAVAAGVLLIAGAAALWHTGPKERRTVSIETRVDAAGFRAVPNGTITVVAAGVLLLAGAAVWLHTGPKQRRPVSIETRVDAAGFRAVPNGAITVIEAGGNR